MTIPQQFCRRRIILGGIDLFLGIFDLLKIIIKSGLTTIVTG